MVTAPVPAHANTAWRGVITPREAEVLELLAAGMTNKQIARELWVSLHTVKYHLGNVYGKIGVRGEHDASERVRAARWWWTVVECPVRS